MARVTADPKPMKKYPTTIAGKGAATTKGMKPSAIQISAREQVLARPSRMRMWSTKGAAAM